MVQSSQQTKNYNGVPPYDSAFVYPNTGIVQRNWYWFLLQLWRACGGSFNQISQSSFLQQVDIYESSTGKFLGKIISSNTKGTPAEPQTLNTSPFTFTADSLGMLAVYGGDVQFSRDGGATYYPIGLTGGSIFMLNGDMVQVTWFSTTPPTVTWFPTATS